MWVGRRKHQAQRTGDYRGKILPACCPLHSCGERQTLCKTSLAEGAETRAEIVFFHPCQGWKIFFRDDSPEELRARKNCPISHRGMVWMCMWGCLCELHINVLLLNGADSESWGPRILHLRRGQMWQLTGLVLSHIRFQIHSLVSLHSSARCFTA